VPPACPAGRAGDGLHIVQAKGKENGLFEPLMDDPVLATGLGDPGLARIQQIEGSIDRFAVCALRRRGEIGTALPCGFNGGFERGINHSSISLNSWPVCSPGRAAKSIETPSS